MKPPHYAAYTDHGQLATPLGVGVMAPGWKHPFVRTEGLIPWWMFKNGVERVVRSDFDPDAGYIRAAMVWWQYQSLVWVTDLSSIRELGNGTPCVYVAPGWGPWWQKGVSLGLFDRLFMLDGKGAHGVPWECLLPESPENHLHTIARGPYVQKDRRAQA